MSQSQDKFVLPGDVIVTGTYTPEQNTVLDDDRVTATAVGFYEIEDDAVKVIPLTGFYTPKPDDLVIGKITSHTSFSWEVNINSFCVSILPAFDIFGKDYSPSKDELSSKLKTGDLIVGRIVNVNPGRDPLMTINGENLGKIDSGELVKISPTKIPRLIGKDGSMIQTIEAATNATITVGQNGLVILKCNNSADLKKAIEAVKIMDSMLDDTNVEEKIQHYVSWQEIDALTAKELLDKKGRKTGYKKITDKDISEAGFKTIDELAASLSEGKTTMTKIKSLKPWFALSPPRQGFKRSTKRLYGQKGVLGYNKELSTLIKRMI